VSVTHPTGEVHVNNGLQISRAWRKIDCALHFLGMSTSFALALRWHAQLVLGVTFAIGPLMPQAYSGIRRDDAIPWMQKSSSGNCVFVFVPNHGERQSEIGPDLNAKEIHAAYTVTGLYNAQDPPRLVWEFSVDALSPPVYVGDDMKTLVVPGDFSELPYPLPEDIIATFVDRGVIASQVRYSDISRLVMLKRLLTSNGCIAATQSSFDATSNEYAVVTNVGEHIVFDGCTGDIKQYHDPVVIAVRRAAIIFALSFLGIVYWRLQQRRSAEVITNKQFKIDN